MQTLFPNFRFSNNVYVKLVQINNQLERVEALRQSKIFHNEPLYSFQELENERKLLINFRNRVEARIYDIENDVILFGDKV